MAGHRESSSSQSTKEEGARLRVRRRAIAIAIVGCVFLAMALLIGSVLFAGAPNPSAPAPTTAPSRSASPRNSELEAFTDACEKSQEWLPGQVEYPGKLSVQMGQATTYGATVDIRDADIPPGKELRLDSAKEPIDVQCVIGARLISVGGGIDVEIPAEAREGGWIYRKFTPSGVVEWSWTVAPRTPVSQKLRLELEPAVLREDASGDDPRSTAYVDTMVNVTATHIDRLAYWFQTQWVLLSRIAGTVGVAILAVLAFSSKAREAIKSLFTRKSRTQTRKRAATASSSTKTPSTKTKQTDERDQKTDIEPN